MTIADTQWTALPVPWAVERPDRIPKQRYYDPEAGRFVCADPIGFAGGLNQYAY